MSVTDTATITQPPSDMADLGAVRDAALQEERAGALTSDTLKHLGDAGLFATRTYAQVGDIDLATTLQTLSTLGAANPAAAWVAGTSLLARTNATAAFGADAFDRLVPPTVQVGGSSRPGGTVRSEADGLVLSGQWRVVSGADTAAALALGVVVEGHPAPHVVIVRRDDYDLDRDWDVIGMRATGSHTVSIDGLRLAKDQFRPMQLTPQFAVLGALTVLAPILGATRAALGVTTGLFHTGRKPTLLAAPTLAASAAARALLAAAASHLNDASTFAEAAVHIAEHNPHAARRRLAQSAVSARSAFEPMLDLYGAAAFNQNARIGMLWRDVAIGSRHSLTTAYVFHDETVSDLLTTNLRSDVV